MPSVPPRALGGARRPAPPAPAVSGSAAPHPPLRILVAGLDRDARAPVEAAVRRALAGRAAREPWTVSLVKVGGPLLVTLHGGAAAQSLSLTCEEAGLEAAIRRAVDADATAPAALRAERRPSAAAPFAPAPAVTPAGTASQVRHVCGHCGRALLVAYESRPGEPRELAPVACPHCWQIEHVEIGAWAAAGRDYRCDKAD